MAPQRGKKALLEESTRLRPENLTLNGEEASPELHPDIDATHPRGIRDTPFIEPIAPNKHAWRGSIACAKNRERGQRALIYANAPGTNIWQPRLGDAAANHTMRFRMVNKCPSINGQFARYLRCAKNLILGISTRPAVKFFVRLDLDPICLFLDGH